MLAENCKCGGKGVPVKEGVLKAIEEIDGHLEAFEGVLNETGAGDEDLRYTIRRVYSELSYLKDDIRAS